MIVLSVGGILNTGINLRYRGYVTLVYYPLVFVFIVCTVVMFYET